MEIIFEDDIPEQSDDRNDSIFNDQYIELSEGSLEDYDRKIDYPFVMPALFSEHVGIPERLIVYRIGFDGKNIVSEYGHVGGKLTVKRREVIPKSNRTIYQQAYQEIYRRWKNKLNFRYRTDVDSIKRKRNNMVMTANRINNMDIIEYPTYIQKKLDGMRFTAYLSDEKIDQEREVMIRSRQGNFFPYLDHIRKELRDILQKLPEGYLLDGELYIHGKTFQAISSILKSRLKVHDEIHKIKAHVFDLIDQERMAYSERLSVLQEIFRNKYDNVVLVETILVNNRSELEMYFKQAISEGFEGLMIRKPDSPYETKRTNNLLKLKNRETDEGTIIDVISGTGTHSDLAIFTIKDSLGIVTNVVPSSSHEDRRDWLKNKDSLIGRKYQFEFQERIKKTNAPRHPVGIGFID